MSHGKDGCIEVKKCIVGDMCWGGERWERGAGSSGGCMTGRQVALTMNAVERGIAEQGPRQGKMGVSGYLRGAGRCVHSDIPITGAGVGWACAH